MADSRSRQKNEVPADKDSLRDFYWDTLKISEHIVSVLKDHGIPETTENKTIRAVAFAELVRNGISVKIFDVQDETPKQKKIGIFTITESGKKEQEGPGTCVIRDMEGNEHSIEIPILKEILGQRYDGLFGEQKKEIHESSEPQINISVPDFNEGIETEDPKDETVPAKPDGEIPEEDDNADPNRMPEFEHDGKYPEDARGRKDDDTFYYNQHDLLISVNGQTGVIHFYVYPLAIKKNERATDILVAAESGGMIRAGISMGQKKAVEIEFADIPFVVRGNFEDGVFRSQVSPLKPDILQTNGEKIIAHPTVKRTSTTYLQTIFNNIPMYVFPASFRKNSEDTGYAPAVVAVKRADMIELLIPTEEGTFAVTGNSGEEILVSAYWIGTGPYDFRVDVEEE